MTYGYHGNEPVVAVPARCACFSSSAGILRREAEESETCTKNRGYEETFNSFSFSFIIFIYGNPK